MDEFVYGLIKENKIKFQSGNFFIFNFPNNLLTLTNIATLFHILKLKYVKPVDIIIKNVAKKQIKAMAHTIFPSIKSMTSEKINLLLQYLCLFGYGNIQIANVSNALKEVVFQVKNSTLCLMNVKLFGRKVKPENLFVEGICAGIAELIFDLDMTAKETNCVTMNKESCYIVAKKSSGKEKPLILNKYDITLLKTLKQQELSNTYAEFIEKVVGHDEIKWNDGIFTFWGCSIFMLPTPSLVFLVKALEGEFGKEVNNLFYHLARVQSRESVNFQAKKLGFKKDKNLLKSVLEHSDISGFGAVKLLKADFQNSILSIKQFYNPYSFYIKELFGQTQQPVDYYVSGLLAGAAEGFFDVPMEDVETKCVALGDGYCLHKSSAKGSETRYPLHKRYLRIIEEKITPQNFII